MGTVKESVSSKQQLRESIQASSLAPRFWIPWPAAFVSTRNLVYTVGSNRPRNFFFLLAISWPHRTPGPTALCNWWLKCCPPVRLMPSITRLLLPLKASWIESVKNPPRHPTGNALSSAIGDARPRRKRNTARASCPIENCPFDICFASSFLPICPLFDLGSIYFFVLQPCAIFTSYRRCSFFRFFGMPGLKLRSIFICRE